MAKKKINFQRRFSKFFLPGILSLALLLCFSVVYAILSVKINVVGTGKVDALRSGDYYYYEGRFYSSPDRYETIPDAEGYALEKMSDAVKQLHDGKTIYMMSSYTVPANEKIEVSGKSAIIKRYKDQQSGINYSFKKGPLIISSSDLQIDVKDSSSAFILDGNDLECIDSTYDDSMFSQYIGAIYSPSGNLVLNGCAGTNNFIIQNHKGVSGAIFKQNGNFQMNNCKLTDNSVEKSGTALKVVNSKVTNSNLFSINCEINSTEFSNNSGSESSSVVSFGLDCTESDITNSGLDKAITVNMDSCNILDNSLTALELSSANSTENYCSYNVSNTSISNNSSNIGGINFVNSGGILENCSIVNNKSTKDITISNQSVGGISASNVPLVLKGKNIIKDNILSGGENSNLDFYPSNLTTNELTAESEIGLSCSSQLITEISPANTNKVAQDANQNTTYLFADDSENYEIRLDSSYLQLALKPTDYYYKNSKFYRDSGLSKPVVSPDGNELSDMSSALSQIGTQKTVYMMQKYTVSKEENISVSNKSVTIKRDSSLADGSLFEVNANLNIDAFQENSSLAIDGNSEVTISSRGGCFSVNSGALLSLQGSSQNNIYIQNSNSTASAAGVAVNEGGTINATYVNFKDNKGKYGGGLINDGSTTLSACTFSGNYASASGGGILIGGTATFTYMSATYFGYNKCELRGGGISIDKFSDEGTAEIVGGTMIYNTAANGGGISLPPVKGGGNIKISGCKVLRNTAIEHGGGIYFSTNSTISGRMEIYENTCNNEDDNLYLTQDTDISISELSSRSSIGIKSEIETSVLDPVVISSSGTSDNAGCFLSDNSLQEVTFADPQLKIVYKDNTNYHYKNDGHFYFDDDYDEKYPINVSRNTKMTKMSDAVNCIDDGGHIIFDQSHYLVSEKEKISVPSAKSLTIQTNKISGDAMFEVNSNFEITVPSTSKLSIDGMYSDGASGFRIANGISLTITGNGKLSISNNTTSESIFGGAIYVGEGSTLKVTDVSFYTNTSPLGGAIYNQGSTELTNCHFEYNKATKHGGAIYVDTTATNTSLNNCRFTENTALLNGGAINIENFSSSGSVTIAGCTISKNTSSQYGGGICMPSSSKSITIYDTAVTDNTGEYGGGVYARSAFSSLSGKIRINGNINSSGENNNLYIASGVVMGNLTLKKFYPGTGSSIGISSATAPTSSNSVEICANNYASFLFSDVSKYDIQYNAILRKTYLVLK